MWNRLGLNHLSAYAPTVSPRQKYGGYSSPKLTFPLNHVESATQRQRIIIATDIAFIYLNAPKPEFQLYDNFLRNLRVGTLKYITVRESNIH